MKLWTAALFLPLAACATVPRQAPPPPLPGRQGPVEVQILAINDFHGNLEAPKLSVEDVAADGSKVRVPAGGVAHLATAARTLRDGHPHSMTISAGDMIGGSPFVSAHFLDEPSIRAMELVGVDYNAVGNHEFDKGAAELLRMKAGGCDKHTSRQPCRLEPFAGARFDYLAANVVTSSGQTLFPGTAIKDFGPVQVGFIGMTLKDTATLVSPAGVAGLTFADEAVTANAAVPALKAAGADAIILLIHEGARTKGGYNDKSCPELSGDILPILARLDPAIDLVVSGHTHAAYICEVPRASGQPLLLTSAGRYGTLITDIRLTFGPDRTLQSHRADNHIVQGEGYTFGSNVVAPVPAYPIYAADPQTKALVDRYVAAAAPEAARVVGRLSGPVTRAQSDDREQSAGNLVADSQLAFARRAGAQLALMNPGGVRADLAPNAAGEVTYGQIFAVQPFGNNVVVTTLTGAQLKALLEQQFASGTNTAESPMVFLPSGNFFFAYDLSRPAGQRIVEMRLDGRPIAPEARYRIAVNNFLASGGDNFTILTDSTDTVDVGLDLDALEAWLTAGAQAPALGRIDNRTPPPAQ
jgi:5'-nucleotidase